MNGKIELKISEGDPHVGYLSMPAHPGEDRIGIVDRSVRLCDCLPNYKGADIVIDFDKENQLIGIEILV